MIKENKSSQKRTYTLITLCFCTLILLLQYSGYNKCINIKAELEDAVFSCKATYDEGTVTEEYISDFYDTLPSDFDRDSLDNPTSLVGVKAILAEIFSAFESERGRAFSFFLFLLGIGFSMAMIESASFFTDELVRVGVYAVGACAVFSRLYPLVEEVRRSIGELSAFFSSLVPVVCGVALSHGAPNTAAAGAAGMNLVLWLLGGVGTSLLMGLCVGVFCTAFASSASEDLVPLSASVSGAFVKLVGIVGVVIGGVTSFQSFVAASADTGAMRAAKYAAQALIPVVGSTVSGAMSTLGGGLAYVSSVIGAGAAAVIFSLASVLLIRMLLYRLIMFVVGFFLDFCSARFSKTCISGLSRALDGLISVYVLAFVIYIFEIVVILKSAASVV